MSCRWIEVDCFVLCVHFAILSIFHFSELLNQCNPSKSNWMQLSISYKKRSIFFVLSSHALSLIYFHFTFPFILNNFCIFFSSFILCRFSRCLPGSYGHYWQCCLVVRADKHHILQIMFCLPSDIVSSIFSSLSPLQASPLSLASSSGRRPRTHHLLSVLIVLTGYCQLIDAICDEHQWWQQQLNKCIPCTVCDASQSIVLRPCQLHSDTVCGTLDDIEFDLNILRAAAAVAVEEERVSWNWVLFLNRFVHFQVFPSGNAFLGRKCRLFRRCEDNL